MTKQISPQRKSLYNAGLVMMAIGGCLFTLPFIAILITMITAAGSAGPPDNIRMVPIAFAFGFVGFVLIGIGGMMRGVAARGTAGSGLILDPEKARDDLQPWARMGGGLVKDVLEEAEVDLGGRPGGQKVIMVKCRHCGKLNEEDSKFCQECGRPI